ncbi:DUF1998 domain-containing protein [Mucilaginibacter sp.]|jgi:hypothetical protein|uniref:DUF1998 domain-containing protein n=1 Tax=Mucilaginibacter sp. TaxID=1882438 RepID=UPI002C74A71F|nr:DUF1998 domain-containing protein [Mucilaginibacter sp.]HTI58981.1 DUF1998 domain-containing protein [Mucilaginibacter sp.]
MARKDSRNRQANEAVSKFKLLSAYGGPGSLVHTAYGSILISCIEEWGFLNKVKELYNEALQLAEDPQAYVKKQGGLQGICLSNDERLLRELKDAKRIDNLLFLTLIPNIELDDFYNEIEGPRAHLAINSEFMPKIFFDKRDHLKTYEQWYNAWTREKEKFFPPKYLQSFQRDGAPFEVPIPLKQDNIVLICKNGHISDFPWAHFLRWRIEQPHALNDEIDLYNVQPCCNRPDIQISETAANATGFDGKWLKCNNPGCSFSGGTSLKGIMSLKLVCPGHKPWESETGPPASYFGKPEVRRAQPPAEACRRSDTRIALTTGNNLYFSRIMTSIFMPPELFMTEGELRKLLLEQQLERAMNAKNFALCMTIQAEIEVLNAPAMASASINLEENRDVRFRFQEYSAFAHKSEDEINISRKDLFVNDVTTNLADIFRPYFHRILRIDRLKITSAQLDFSRVEPYESGSTDIMNRNIFRSRAENVLSYPVVENFGEGIFFAFDHNAIQQAETDTRRFSRLLNRRRNRFAEGATYFAETGGWRLYMTHTFAHLIMRELEFRCGYPTASLSERLFVSNDAETKMYGCLIYTAEGAEGSMGGLIAQTRETNLNDLLRSALVRATICNSDPLCWRSDGQGLFELNLASCFACGLVSETSCEHRNIYLDRQVLIDSTNGFFKDIINRLK